MQAYEEYAGRTLQMVEQVDHTWSAQFVEWNLQFHITTSSAHGRAGTIATDRLAA